MKNVGGVRRLSSLLSIWSDKCPDESHCLPRNVSAYRCYKNNKYQKEKADLEQAKGQQAKKIQGQGSI